MAATFDVMLERSGDDARVVVGEGSNPLTLRLHTTSTAVTGSISGTARDTHGLAVDVSGTLSGSAPADPAIAVAGAIDGDVGVAGGSCSNNGHVWSLSPG